MTQNLEIRGKLLAKNTVLNFFGQIIPLFVALFTIPYIIHGLGTERFGVLSLAWVVIGYFSILDLGLGRATTKFVAEALGKNETGQIPNIVWTSFVFQLLLGILGSVILVIVTPMFVERILNIPSDLIEETKKVFYLLGFFIPVVLCSLSFRGVLEAGQRFNLVNVVKIPASSLTFLLPAIGVFFDFKLPSIIGLLLISKVGVMITYLILCFCVYPEIKKKFFIDSKIFTHLLSFGGWVTICNILIPILVYLDRFLIGALLTITAVGFYSVCYDILSRLQVFPGSLAVTLFPAFSALELDKDKLKRTYAHSLKYLLLAMGPIIFVLVIFAENILSLWLGSDWASKTTLVFQILAIGILINALSQMPANLLDGIGRPDLRAKIFLSYVIPYVVLLWLLITKFGIVGAALAWTIRAFLEFLLFFGTAWKIMALNHATFIENGLLRGVIAYVGIAIVALFMLMVSGKTMLTQGIITMICLILFALIVWIYVLSIEERQFLLSAINRLKR